MKIFELLQEGKGPAAISKLLGCSKPTIQKIQHAIAVGGTPADKKPVVSEKKPPASDQQPHVTPKVSSPVDVNKTLSQYNNQAQSESEAEGATS